MRDTVFPDAASTTETRTALPSTISPARSSRRVAAPKRRMASPARSPALQAGLPTMGASSTKANGAGMQYRDCSTPCHTRASASRRGGGLLDASCAGGWVVFRDKRSTLSSSLSQAHRLSGPPQAQKTRGAGCVGSVGTTGRVLPYTTLALWTRGSCSGIDLRVRLIG